jgi:magnesium chelatase subunit I
VVERSTLVEVLRQLEATKPAPPRAIYPFWWYVGQERLRQAVELFALDPGLGSLLVYGETGTGKTSALLSISDFLPAVPMMKGCIQRCVPWEPPCAECKGAGRREYEKLPAPVYAVPTSLGAGIRDVETATRAMERILPHAKRGLAILDPLNAYDPPLVAKLLQQSAPHPQGQRPTVMVAAAHDLREPTLPLFALNFTLGVRVEGREDLEERIEIVRRMKEYSAGVTGPVDAERKAMKTRIEEGRALLPQVEISEGTSSAVEGVCKRFLDATKARLDPLAIRGTFLRVCRAWTALSKRRWVTVQEMEEASEFFFTHRLDAVGIKAGMKVELKF